MTLKVHHLRPAPGAHTRKTRVGRGEGSKGKSAGRGTKGSKARTQVPASFEGGQMPLHMRVPKLKGFRNPFRVEYQVVNLTSSPRFIRVGGEVTVDDLVDKGAFAGRPVKVLGAGRSRSHSGERHAFSASARRRRSPLPVAPRPSLTTGRLARTPDGPVQPAAPPSHGLTRPAGTVGRPRPPRPLR
jgi:large subunit ribosomal protein L15